MEAEIELKPGNIKCSNPLCQITPVKACTGCRITYCSKECQNIRIFVEDREVVIAKQNARPLLQKVEKEEHINKNGYTLPLVFFHTLHLH